MDKTAILQLSNYGKRLTRLESNEGEARLGPIFPQTNLYQGRQFLHSVRGINYYYEKLISGPPNTFYRSDWGGTDLFNRPNSTTSLSWLESSQGYIVAQGMWGVDTNRAKSISDTNDDLVWFNSLVTDPLVTAIVSGTLNSGVTYRTPPVVFRGINNANKDFLAVRLKNGNIELVKRVAGVYTVLNSKATTTTDGTSYTLTASCYGNLIFVWLDGTFMFYFTLTVAEAAFLDATYCGYGLNKAGAPATAAYVSGFKVRHAVGSGNRYGAIDSFNRADEVPIVAPDYGPAYDNAGVMSVGYAPLSVKNNRLTFVFGTFGGSTFGSASLDAGSADVLYQTRIITLSGRMIFYVRAYFDLVDVDIYGYYFEINLGTDNKGRLYYYRNDGVNPYVYELKAVSPSDFASGDTLQILANGPNLAVLQNGETVVAINDAAFQDKTLCGVSIINDFTAEVDNLYIQPF